MALNSFQPIAGTLTIPSTAASATTVQITTGACQTMRVTNMSTLDAYFLFGSSSTYVVAAPTTTPSTAAGTPILQRTNEVFTCPPQCWASAITTAGQANLAFTPGSRQ